jgi:hypothetical protein
VLSNSDLAELLAREAERLKAKISAERIINFMPLADLKQWAASVRRKSRQ